MGKAAGTGMKSSRQNSRQNKIIIGNSTYKGKQAMLCSGRTAGGGVPTPAVLPVCYRLDYQAEKKSRGKCKILGEKRKMDGGFFRRQEIMFL